MENAPVQRVDLYCCPVVSLNGVGGAFCCSQTGLTCSMAGVREGVGSDGLQLFMGEKSEAVTSRVGGLICRTLGGLRVFPELRVLAAVLLLADDELVSASTKLISSPD